MLARTRTRFFGIIRSRTFLGAGRTGRITTTLFQGMIASLLLTTAPAFAAKTQASSTHVQHKSASGSRATSSTQRVAPAQRLAAMHHRGRAFVRTVAVHRGDGDRVASAGEQAAGELLDSGTASWYSQQEHNNRTSSGERFDENAMTAAHGWLPMGTRVKVTVVGSNESVIVTINDRQGSKTRVIDLSKGAARELGILSRGTAKVTLTRA